MNPIGGFSSLRVWQAAMDLACEAYAVAQLTPPDERFGLSSQIRRAAVSVPSNIAEGWGRRSKAEFVRYARVANGSLRELQTQLLLCQRLNLATGDVITSALSSAERVGRLLTALERSLRAQERQPTSRV